MNIIDNINNLLGDDLKETIHPGSKLKIAASCFSIYAFEALKTKLMLDYNMHVNEVDEYSENQLYNALFSDGLQDFTTFNFQVRGIDFRNEISRVLTGKIDTSDVELIKILKKHDCYSKISASNNPYLANLCKSYEKLSKTCNTKKKDVCAFLNVFRKHCS